MSDATTTAPHARPAKLHGKGAIRHVFDERVWGYLEDPFLRRLYDEINTVGTLRSITVDLTHVCNIRCQGCYFFAEGMDETRAPRDEAVFDAFVESERARGTNYVIVLGGEPSLMLGRLRKLNDNFITSAVTNGIRKIPMQGFEDMSIFVSVWGDHDLDRQLRGGGRLDVFARALENYKGDGRVMWYFTVSAGNAAEVEPVVEQCVENGNYVYFSYYEDNDDLGGDLDHRLGFAEVRIAIDRMIDRYPDRILTTTYMNKVATEGRLYGMEWGYDVCGTVSTNYEKNALRLENGQPYSPHFRAYLPDLRSVRRCCVGEDRDCAKCRNSYAKHTWIMVNSRLHAGSKEEFTAWLTTMYSFYLTTRGVDRDRAARDLLPEVHARLRAHSAA